MLRGVREGALALPTFQKNWRMARKHPESVWCSCYLILQNEILDCALIVQLGFVLLSSGAIMEPPDPNVHALWQRLRSPEARFHIMVSLSIFDPE